MGERFFNAVTETSLLLRTPIVVILFNRPDHARRLRHCLENQQDRDLYVVVDGAREGKSEEEGLVAESVNVFKDWAGRTKFHISDENMGCKLRISSGLDWVFDQVDRAIILEDDLVPHAQFFLFCDEMLDKYADSDNVMSVCGTKTFPGEVSNPYFLSRYNNCWGWATWKRAWGQYEDDFLKYSTLNFVKNLKKSLGSYRAAIYWYILYRMVLSGKRNSWAYCWMITCFLNRGLSIYPASNFVINAGFGDSSTHTSEVKVFMPQTYGERDIFPLEFTEKPSAPFEEADRWIEDNIYSKSIKVRVKWLLSKISSGNKMKQPDSLSNIRPGISPLYFRLRLIANAVRSFLFFTFKARWVKRRGMVRIPWSVQLWSPHKDISFGDRVQFGHHSLIHCDIQFGDSVLVARNVAFVGRDDHRFDIVGKVIWDSPRGDSYKTFVESDVWVGHGSIVLAGVVIGEGSIVAAGSVVIKDVPPYSIVAGSPAKVLKMRFTPKEISEHKKLLSR